jgi:hypothetical protein
MSSIEGASSSIDYRRERRERLASPLQDGDDGLLAWALTSHLFFVLIVADFGVVLYARAVTSGVDPEPMYPAQASADYGVLGGVAVADAAWLFVFIMGACIRSSKFKVQSWPHPLNLELHPNERYLNIDKPQRMTSHDVVARVRASSAAQGGACGHARPDGYGVAAMVVGTATRLVEYLAEADKAYRATLVLGNNVRYV